MDRVWFRPKVVYPIVAEDASLAERLTINALQKGFRWLHASGTTIGGYKVAANCYLRPSIDSREQREVLQVGDLGVPSGEGRPFKNSMAFGIFHQGRTSRRKFSSLTGLKRVGKFLPLN